MAAKDSEKGERAARDAGFQRRTLYAYTKAAVAATTEDPQTPNHAERLDLAGNILGGQAPIFNLTLGVTTNPTILANIDDQGGTAAVPDADLEFTVNSQFTGYAVAYATLLNAAGGAT